MIELVRNFPRTRKAGFVPRPGTTRNEEGKGGTRRHKKFMAAKGEDSGLCKAGKDNNLKWSKVNPLKGKRGPLHSKKLRSKKKIVGTVLGN